MAIYRGSAFNQARGKGRCPWSVGASRLRSTTVAPPLAPTAIGAAISNIDIATILIEEEAPKITDAKYVASYNWISGNSPTILVPGFPPAWTPPSTDTQLQPDSDDVFRDINAARYPLYPMEPALRSVQALRPEFNLDTIDIFACGSTLENIMSFVSLLDSKSFRFDVDLVGSTVFFIRRENSPTELMTDLRGYGHTFPEAYTSWDAEVKSSISHQRIVQYNFGGLDMLVRTESDGYIKSVQNSTKTTTHSTLNDALESISVNSNLLSGDGKLSLKMQGSFVPQEQIFEIKTRAHYVQYDMNNILPRLWLSQTSRFLIAYHNYGVFDRPNVKDVRNDVMEWERENSALLARFHAVIKHIIDIVSDSQKQQCEVSWNGEGPLLLTEQVGETRRALTLSLIESFESS